MSIPESQLDTWSHQGAITSAASTHHAIKHALDRHKWPTGINYEAYLQGSYANDTNIRANSDVDLVIELTSSFYHSALTLEQEQALRLTKSSYGYTGFRGDVITALKNHLGTSSIMTGQNSIKLPANSGRLNADAVPCVTYKQYGGTTVIAEGITFWNQKTNDQIVNYPRQHRENGTTKHDHQHTNGYYKPTVRIFKNARDTSIQNDQTLARRYRSYFLESLLYNVPDNQFGSSYGDTFCNIVNYLHRVLPTTVADKFTTQSGQHYLFGKQPVQWNKQDAIDLVNRFVNLWNQW